MIIVNDCVILNKYIFSDSFHFWTFLIYNYMFFNFYKVFFFNWIFLNRFFNSNQPWNIIFNYVSNQFLPQLFCVSTLTLHLWTILSSTPLISVFRKSFKSATTKSFFEFLKKCFNCVVLFCWFLIWNLYCSSL